MRMTLALLVVLVMAAPAVAGGPSRAEAVVRALVVDDATARGLVDLVTAHDRELAKLHEKRARYMRQLLAAHELDAKSIDRLLDNAVEMQRALAEADLLLISRVRQLVPAQKAVQLLFLMSVTEPAPREQTTRTAYDPDAFPPASRPPCDPFASMHGCR
jgi:hypothetical protein